MVEKMKGFVKDCKEICDAVSVVRDGLTSAITDVEKLLEELGDADRHNRAVVRDYDL